MMSHPIDRKALEEAINQARAGNDAEFATLYKYYYPQVCKHLIRMVGSYEDGHNLCQDSFLKAWRAIRGKAESQFRGNTEPEFRSWLYRIATNTANDYLRVPRPEDRLNGSREHPTGLGSVEDKDFINRALAELPEQERRCLLLSVDAGFRQCEIAKLLRISKGRVSQILTKAREHFRQAYRYLNEI